MLSESKIMAICNQKGGVGKTVTAVNLGIGLARMGKRVLLCDVDAQGSLTASLGYSNGTVTAPDGGWYDGWNSFTVECGLACLVYVSNGDNMTKLEAEATDEDTVYRFTATLSEGDEIIVLVRGDVDLDGRLTAADLVRLSRHFGGMYELDKYSDLAADVDQDGRLTAADLVRLSQYFGGMYKLYWNLAE